MTPSLDDLVFECLERLEQSSEPLERVLADMEREYGECAAGLRERLTGLQRAGLLSTLRERPDGDEFPAELGDFALIRQLGQGGMGVVYLARQRSMQRDVALKLVRPGELYQPGTRARFEREARAAARLSHPDITAVHAIGESNGIPYLAMEYVPGASLERLLLALGERTPETLSGASLRLALEQVLAG